MHRCVRQHVPQGKGTLGPFPSHNPQPKPSYHPTHLRIGGKLAKAISRGDVDAVRTILEPVCDSCPDSIYSHLQEALIYACKLGRKEIAELLLDFGAVIEARDVMGMSAPLRWACSRGDVALINMLIARRSTVDADVLLWAVTQQQPASVSTLLARCEVGGEELDSALICAAKGGSSIIIKLLLERGADVQSNGNRAILTAACYNRSAAVTILCNHGADIHDRQDCAVRIAAFAGHSKVVKLLLDRGADKSAALHGELLRLVNRGDVEAIRSILKLGANLHDEDDWALRMALHQRYPIVKELVDLGNYRQFHPALALIAFAAVGNHSEVDQLIKNGVDLSYENHKALHTAVSNEHTRVIDRLVSSYDHTGINEATNLMHDHAEQIVRTRFAAAQARKALKNPGIDL